MDWGPLLYVHRFGTDTLLLHRIENVGMSPDLLGKQLISFDGYNPVSPILKALSRTSILDFVGGVVVVRAIDEDANAGNTAALIVEIWLNEDVDNRRVLGKIGKTELSLVCNLDHALMSGATLTRADLGGASLWQADLAGACLGEVNF